MLPHLARLDQGCVVASGSSVFVVWAVAEGEGPGPEITLLRIESQSDVRHRADVVPEHWSDLAQSGLPLQDVVVRCVPIARYGTANLTRLGKLPDALLLRLAAALKREAEARRFEDSPPFRSNLLASTASRGRRVAVVRYG